MKSLIIIDFQNDFCQPSGSLYVKGAEDAKKGIISYVQKNSEKFNQIIYTKDWHTPEMNPSKKMEVHGLCTVYKIQKGQKWIKNFMMN